MPFFVPPLKKADYEAAQNVDVFIANSAEVQHRIKKYYGKPSTVINPPVDVSRFTPARERDDFYVVTGRQVPYKRIDLAVRAATELGVPLKVFGTGSEHERLVKLAGPTVEFYTDRYGDASDSALINALNHAKGFIFPSEEDFGIVAIEALAAGAPVIALARGGSRDIVEDGVSGVLFRDQTTEQVADAIRYAQSLTFLPGTLRRKAKRFDKSLFITKIRKVVSDNYGKNAQ
jgi:glycosyltransferase involved in cell wall biosynthesis